MSISLLLPLFPQELLYTGVAGAAIFGMEKEEDRMQLQGIHLPQKFDNTVQQDMLDVSFTSKLCIRQIMTEMQRYCC
jgi:hypothetical protein